MRGCVAALPCLWATPTGEALPPTRKPKHPADEFCERVEAALAETGAHADATINPLTGERNALVQPYSQGESTAMVAADGASDASGEEMEEGDEEEDVQEDAEEEAGAEERDQANGGEGGEVECAAEDVEADGGEHGEAEGAEADGGEGSALEPDGSSTVAVVEQPEHPWAPKDTDEMLQEIADAGYGVSGDRSSALAPRLIKAYNSKADIYEQVVQNKGQPLREGFSVVKVRAARA